MSSQDRNWYHNLDYYCIHIVQGRHILSLKLQRFVQIVIDFFAI